MQQQLIETSLNELKNGFNRYHSVLREHGHVPTPQVLLERTKLITKLRTVSQLFVNNGFNELDDELENLDDVETYLETKISELDKERKRIEENVKTALRVFNEAQGQTTTE